MLNTFIKTYSNRTYRHVTMVRHKGTVIAFALDSERRIFYSVLDLENTEIKSPLDVNYWLGNPKELFFPNEIAEVGVGVADQTLLPAVKKGSRTPAAPGTRVREDEKDLFLSTTARLTADAAFQALSDGRHVFIFRQAIGANHADMVFKRDADGNPIKDADGNPVPIVDSTLLVDRFVLAGTDLKTKMEVRYQRSRSKTRPESRKDSLGAKDMEDNPFFEPTQELRFIGNLTEGRFTALLLPTQVVGVQRWQIFSHNSKTGAMDSFNIERAQDGLFNTRGSQEAMSGGHAESALRFDDGNWHIDLGSGVPLGETFTQEAWLYPTNTDGVQALLTDNGRDKNSAPSLWTYQGRAIRAGFGDGEKWYEFTTNHILALHAWNHVAVTFNGESYRVFVNGEERHRTSQVEVYLDGEKQEERESLAGKKPVDRSIRYFGEPNGNSLQGTIDEIRLWRRPRLQAEIQADRRMRLTGLEPGLAGYWRFDEASGDTVYDQTDNAVNGAKSGGEWVTSEAPIGENSGLQRGSFRIANREPASGPAALLYYHQEKTAGGYDGKEKPLKHSARVMLALATQSSGGVNKEIAALDFGVANTGRLAQTPDHLELPVIQRPTLGGKTIDELLNEVSTAEQEVLGLRNDIVNLTDEIDVLNGVIDIVNEAINNTGNRRVTDIRFGERARINEKIQDLQDKRAALAQARSREQNLQSELSNGRVWLYEHSSFRGRVISYGRNGGQFGGGFVGYTDLRERGFNDIISSIRMSEALQAKVYEHANRGGKSKTFTSDTSYVGNDWNDIISSLDIQINSSFNQKLNAAVQARIVAENAVATATQVLREERTNLEATRQDKMRQRREKEALLTSKQTDLDKIRISLNEGVAAPMSLVFTDPLGLSLTGGLLEFAWTNEAPLLFDSATGKLALYFRGTDDQFFVTYYNTLTQRPQYRLVDERGSECLLCVARSTEPEMDQLKINILAGADDATCTAMITGPADKDGNQIIETWRQVPRNPERFAKVLNGLANERAYLGAGTIVVNEGRIEAVNIAAGSRRALEKGMTLRAGDLRMTVQENAAKGATTISVQSTATSAPSEEVPVFFIEYDYGQHAGTNKIPSDLSNGSLLILSGALSAAGEVQIDQELASGNTISCLWTAAAPGHTLAFDGAKSYAHLNSTNQTDLKKFAADGDVTLEAWVRPQVIENRGQIIQHRSASSRYALGLERRELRSALRFDGVNDYIGIANHQALNFSGAITIEAWIKPAVESSRTIQNIVAHGYANNPNAEVFLRILQRDGKFYYEAGSWNGANHLVAFEMPAADQTGLSWIHLAGVYDGSAWRFFRNGVEVAAQNENTGALPVPADWAIGSRGGAPERLFKGEIDDVRIWKRGRTQAEIQADMNRQLGGNETDLVGYWHFEAGYARDYSRHNHESTKNGNPQLAVSPLPGYAAYAGAGELFVQAKEPFAAGSWTHLAAAYNQSYALRFDGSSYLDCGADSTLDIAGDMTIEVFLQAANQNPLGILSKGKIDDGTEDNSPCTLYADDSNRIVFAFEDVENGNHVFTSDANAFRRGYFTRLAVTRKQQVVTAEQRDGSGNLTGTTVEQWHDIKFYKKNDVGAMVACGAGKYEGPEIGSSSSPFEIGRASLPGFIEGRFKGVISEVRIWNVARDPENLGVDLKGNEKGLVSWWRFEENQGNIGFDSKSSNHARFKGNIEWLKNPEFNASRLTLYRNGETVATEFKNASSFPVDRDQFTLGALGNSTVQNFFQGEMEEVRIWRMPRTQEQVQDNLFTRLLGEKEELIAYYTFDAEKPGQLTDHSFRGNDLTLRDTLYVFSTAPINEDAPQVRSALAGLRTPFNGILQSRPAVQEYGDLQYDVEGNLIGVLKRCYALVRNGQWHLITGFKVGNLVTEWIGQVQFDPEMIGFIEGPPPAPSENLTFFDYVLKEFTDYDGATAIEITDAQKTTFTYSANRDRGFDMNVELAAEFGGGTQEFVSTPVALAFPIVLTEVVEADITGGIKATFEHSLGWLQDASIGRGKTTTKTSKLELRGIVENLNNVRYPYPKLGRRYVPDNVGFALVQSETADVFALRLAHNNALVSYQMRPNPDIPKDWNIISFPINPHYTKQGTLDGKVGFDPDVDYPNALTYSPDSSYFKPIEAYALKNRIQREEEALRAFYEQWDAGAKGRRQDAVHFSSKDLAEGKILNNLPKIEKRNLVNTYVWTSDGGMFAETQETFDVLQETMGGSYSFKGQAGGRLSIETTIFKVAAKFEVQAMFGGHINLTVTKSEESENTFGVNAELSGVERNIYFRTPEGEIVMDNSDPNNPKPKRWPGKVNAYRFMTFYLEPKPENFDAFFNKVVDPIWIAQSDDPNAAALREAQQSGKKPPCWRVMHRVTFVSRILPDFSDPTAPPLESALKALDIESNYELIKLLEPFVANKLTNFAEFSRAIRETIKTYHPELQPHTEAIIQYMSLYFGITEDTLLLGSGEGDFVDGGAPLLPEVDAGPDNPQTIAINSALELQGTLINSQQPLENLLIVWSKVSGPAEIAFDDAHRLVTQAHFTSRGKYVLRLTMNDGLFAASDDLIVVVNSEPQVSAGVDQMIRLRDTATLQGALLDSGLGDEASGTLTYLWSVESGPGEVTFANPNALATTATFTKSGPYLLRLTANNGFFTASDDMVISVAGRVTQGLQTLHVFKEGSGETVRDIAALDPPLPFALPASGATWVEGGLALAEPTILETAQPPTRLFNALRSSHELTLETWLKPAVEDQPGLARIVTFSGGPAIRNFTLGQRGNQFYAAVRTDTTNQNASDKALAGGAVTPDALMHVVITRSAAGVLRLFVNGVEVAQRSLPGVFSNWVSTHRLALGNEVGESAGYDRAWSGEYHLVAIYDRALSAEEVQQNFEFGADTNLPPIVFAGGDQTLDLPNAAALQGFLLDDRLMPEQISVKWTQVSGVTNVVFENPDALNTQANFEDSGVYVLRLTASDEQLSASDELRIVVNKAPSLHAGSTQWLALPAAVAELDGVITHDGLGDPALPKNISVNWSQLEGPGQAVFANPQALSTYVSFTVFGKYVLQLSVHNGHQMSTAAVTIFVNQAPNIRAGAEAIVNLPKAATLNGEIIELGLADPDGVTMRQWSKVSGAGEVTFADASLLSTTASFSKSGVYVLKLTIAISGAHFNLQSEAQVQLTANAAPEVDAGPDVQITLPAVAELEGTISDDGFPDPPGRVSAAWSKVSGPGSVQFSNVSSAYSTARFSQPGNYVLQLLAKDYPQAPPVSDEVHVEVLPSPRVTEGLQALYLFDEGSGNVIHDVAGAGAPLDLTMQQIGNNSQPLQWLGKGLRIVQPTVIKSNGPATRLINALKSANEFTIEAWVKRAASIPLDRSPGRIATLSLDGGHRNFTLGQLHEDRWQVRLRTTNTDDNGVRLNNGQPAYQDIDLVPELCHVVYTRRTTGTIRFYLNSVDPAPSTRPRLTGDFSNWEEFELALANELSLDRPWLGELHLIAIYSRALTAAEVKKNFEAGV
ncbi:MAG: hypothetical protein DKINENOH_01468 [bacterium]|nr:hypothetical protein [bacterium]